MTIQLTINVIMLIWRKNFFFFDLIFIFPIFVICKSLASSNNVYLCDCLESGLRKEKEIGRFSMSLKRPCHCVMLVSIVQWRAAIGIFNTMYSNKVYIPGYKIHFRCNFTLLHLICYISFYAPSMCWWY